MISADFYLTAYDLTNPVRQLTDNIEYNPNGTETDIELSNAYWLGWMKWETVPDCWKFSTYTQTADTITIDFVTPSQNVNVGYLARRYTSAQTGRRWSNMYRRSNDSVSMYSVGYPNQYLNKYDIMGCASIRQFWVQIFAACEYKTSSSATTYINSGIQLGSRYVDEYLSFFNGDSTLDFSLNVGSVGSVNISLDINNIEEDNTFIIEGTQGGYDYKIKAYFAFVCANTAPDVTASGDYVTGATATNIIPMIGVSIEDDYYLLCGDTSHFTQVLGQIQIQVLANYVFNPNQMFNNMLVGGYKAEIDKNEFNSMAVNDTYFSGNTAFVKTASGNSGVLNRVLSPQEIMTIIGIMPRVGRGYDSTNIANYGYTENVIWATYVTEDNEFTATLITGDLSDDEFKAKLRPWQYDVDEWAENDYTEEDLPPYEGDGDTEDEESGQSIPIQRRLSMGAVSSFITCYGLTAAQVQEFGKKLWSSWVDNGGLVMAMVENFKFLIDSGIASNTGSIDISSVLDFVVSLKVYPCDIRNLFAFSNSDSDGKVYIGRGTYGLEVSNSAIYKAINQLGYLDAGTYNVPRPFGDFRDYTNINITVYVPYCGTIELNPADVIGRTLSGTYVVDVMTGECTFFLEVVAVTDSGEHRYIVGTCDGQLGVTIPVSATNSGQIAARRFSDVAQFATTVGGFFNRNMQIGNDIAMQMATLGASGMASKNPEMASAREQNIKMTGSQAYADNALGLLKDVTGQFGNSLTRAAIDAPNISGGSGIASFANPDCVWIQIRHGIYPKVNNYDHTVGKVSTKSAPLSSYHGFTVCHNVDVSNLPCTEEEKSAIKQLLETGVYL